MCSIKDFLDNCDNCSDDRYFLNVVPLKEETCILSEISLLKSDITSQLRICDIHRNIIIETTNKRYRRKNCGVPSVNVILKYHNTTKAGDRHVTPEMFQRIVTKTGIFIPIGTPICRLCREKLLGNNSIEHVEEFIPGLTAWRYYEAKKHTANVGVGLPVKELTEKKVKINIDSLEHFIDFVTSSHVIKD
ncbi:unnamed protein product [Mytilus coruscus]|uniref:Uncharacterized protein n=1 Tax=Mytilus coruscus TaxID=42192 RepID=A0A6J8D781_MYTCO|nr:unnamed protein product [Mytilus coruscus]